MASITFGPPGWHTQEPMSARVRPWSARNSSTSSPRYRSTIAGTAASSTMRSPFAPTSQPIVRSVSG